MTTIPSIKQRASENLVPMFHFRLSKGQSIGPNELRSIWQDACGIREVTIGRTSRGDNFLYSLGAPQRVMHSQVVEERLRALLGTYLPNATIDLVRI
ncbi:MAG TPA: hypothetical protein VH082_08735 [Rudaea sp.]|jgi:hypothetical protein|nr:hypothetical protein [Rudaea sp.]